MKLILKWYLTQNIYLQLFPFLIFYISICLLFSNSVLVGDEFRYITFANNLTSGFYSPPYPNINLWNGPGYPIILVPFVFLKSPFIIFRLLNAFLLYFSLVIFYTTSRSFASKKQALFFTLLPGLYYPIYGDSLLIVTECFSWFLISLICLLLVRCFNKRLLPKKLLFITAFAIAYLAMTKVIFGYVIVAMLLVSLGMFLWPTYRNYAKKSFLLFFVSFVFCIPWLCYTFSITHKTFYFTNSGGMSLYTMSSPFQNELGDWEILGEGVPHPNHAAFIDSISKLPPIQQNEAYQTRAILNIKQYPKKYFSNWVANLGRLFFSMPFSNKAQSSRMYFLIIPNMFILVVMSFVIGIGLWQYKKFPIALQLLFIFMTIYLLGSSFVSAYKRMFYITMPFWFLLIGYFFTTVITVKIREGEQLNNR